MQNREGFLACRSLGKRLLDMKKQRTNWTYIGVGVVVLVLGGLFVFTRGGAGPQNNTAKPLVTKDAEEILRVSMTDWVKGNPAAKVTLVEYADFQCPACKSYASVVKQAEAEFGKDMRFVYRHFPLTEIHKTTLFSSQAAEAAGKQGKFWQMHDLLYEKQQEWSEKSNAESLMEGYAASLQLNMDQFKKDVKDPAVLAKVKQNRAEGEKLGIKGTPSFFLNGKLIENPQGFQGLKSILSQALADANNSPK